MTTDSQIPICDCCGEAPASQKALGHGFSLCDLCSLDRTCSQCDRLIDRERRLWETELCHTCKSREELYDWLDRTEAAITEAATAAGWTVRRTSSGISEAVYLYLSRGEDETISVRIADHEAGRSLIRSYDDTDYSVEREASETAVDMEIVFKAIRRRESK